MLVNIHLEQAQEELLKNIAPPAAEPVSIMQALGRVATRDIHAPNSLPSCPQSAVDGFAIHKGDVSGGRSLLVSGYLRAGEVPALPLVPGQTVGVVTGGILPQGTGAVIPEEQAKIIEDHLSFLGEISPGNNIKQTGEDFRAGELLVRSGTTLTPGLISLLAAFGCSRISVYRRPQVAILSLGEQIVPCGSAIAPGQIPDSNGPLLSALAMRDGGEVAAVEITGSQEPAAIKEHLIRLLRKSDLVLSTGGTYAGVCIDVRRQLQQDRGTPLFWGVRMKSGDHSGAVVWDAKPILFLSGNPAACAVGYQSLAAPVLRSLQGLDPYPRRCTAVCTNSFPQTGGLRRFVRGHAVCDHNGWQVTVLPGQKSSMLRSLINCNALIDLPAGNPPLESGAKVSIILFTTHPQ